MPKEVRIIAKSVRGLAVAILGLQLAAAGALVHVQIAPRTDVTRESGAARSDLELAGAAALPVNAVDTTPPPTTQPVQQTSQPAPSTIVAPSPASDPVPVHTDMESPDPIARVEGAYDSSVPSEWRDAITVHFQLIDGNTSYAFHDGTIQISSVHAHGGDALLQATVTHEFGHLIAFRYGSQAFNGAAPDGWPTYSDVPEEAWADCVSHAFTGLDDPSHGLPSCTDGSLSWTADWLAAGPAGHPVTGR